MIKNIVIFIVLVAVIVFGYEYITKDNVDVTKEDPQKVIEENNEEDNIIVNDYCSDLKTRTVGQDNSHFVLESINENRVYTGMTVSGCVYGVNDSYGGWAPFEAQIGAYSLKLLDGTILDEGPLSVLEQNWMESAISGEDIQFKGELTFDSQESGTEGELFIRNENASGLEEFDREIIIPVGF